MGVLSGLNIYHYSTLNQSIVHLLLLRHVTPYEAPTHLNMGRFAYEEVARGGALVI
jgi:hypothetical protein